MATTKPDVNTNFSKGSSGTNELKEVYGDPFKGYDPKAIISSWKSTDGLETSGLDDVVVGNQDFVENVDMDYSGAPKIKYFAPNISARSEVLFSETEDTPDPGEPYDLTGMTQDVIDAIAENYSEKLNGSLASPSETTPKIAEQAIGQLTSGESYKGSTNAE